MNNRLKRSTLRTGLGSTSSPPVPTIHPPRPVRFRWKSRAMSTHGSSFMREAFDRRARNSVNRARNIEPFVSRSRECVSMSEPRWIRATSGRDDRQSLPRRWYNRYACSSRLPHNCHYWSNIKMRKVSKVMKKIGKSNPRILLSRRHASINLENKLILNHCTIKFETFGIFNFNLKYWSFYFSENIHESCI